MIGCVAASDIAWKKERLDIAGCARAASLRIGEAGNPGPRARAVPRGFSLEEAPVNLPQTIRLGVHSWKQFLMWVSISREPLELFLRLPIFWHIVSDGLVTCNSNKAARCFITGT